MIHEKRNGGEAADIQLFFSNRRLITKTQFFLGTMENTPKMAIRS